MHNWPRLTLYEPCKIVYFQKSPLRSLRFPQTTQSKQFHFCFHHYCLTHFHLSLWFLYSFLKASFWYEKLFSVPASFGISAAGSSSLMWSAAQVSTAVYTADCDISVQPKYLTLVFDRALDKCVSSRSSTVQIRAPADTKIAGKVGDCRAFWGYFPNEIFSCLPWTWLTSLSLNMRSGFSHQWLMWFLYWSKISGLELFLKDHLSTTTMFSSLPLVLVHLRQTVRAFRKMSFG